MSKAKKALIAYMTALSIFTVYVLMDTFVITKVYGEATVDASSNVLTEEEEDALEAGRRLADSNQQRLRRRTILKGNAEAVSSTDSYKDENISIRLSEYRKTTQRFMWRTFR